MTSTLTTSTVSGAAANPAGSESGNTGGAVAAASANSDAGGPITGADPGSAAINDVCAVDNGGCFPSAKCIAVPEGRVCECAKHQLGDGIGSSGCRERLVDLNASFGFACVLSEAGAVYCWGSNGARQLGDGTTEARRTPVRVQNLQDVAALGHGYAPRSCAILHDKTVRCWGNNQNGLLGTGKEDLQAGVVTVPGLSGVSVVAHSISGTCAALEDAAVRCWGNMYALGLESAFSATPTTIWDSSAAITELCMEGEGNCALLDDGRLHCWGYEGAGELGVSMAMLDSFGGWQAKPAAVPLVDQVVHVAKAGPNTCALRKDGSIRCWGKIAQRIGETVDLETDSAVDLALSAPSGVLVAVRGDSTLQAWKYSDTSLPAPSAIGQFSSIRISAGFGFTCALRKDSIVSCWGDDQTMVGDTMVIASQ